MERSKAGWTLHWEISSTSNTIWRVVYYNWVCFPTQQTVKNTRSRKLEPHVYYLSEYEPVKSIVNKAIKDSDLPKKRSLLKPLSLILVV